MIKKEPLKILLKSTLVLFAVFALMQIIHWLSMITGAYLSHFEGKIYWDKFMFYASSGKWYRRQIVLIYLLPYVVFLGIYFILFSKKRTALNKSNYYHLFYGWGYVLMHVLVMFLPLWQIINKKGIYYALAWLRLPYIDQIVLGVFLTILFLYGILRVSRIFSFLINSDDKIYLNRKEILNQIIFIWFLPFLILTSVIYVASGLQLVFPVNYFLAGVFLTLLLNIPVISGYKVIVK